MHKNFAGWLRAAGLEPNDETSPKQWAVITGYQPTTVEIISFARLFYGFGSEEDETLDTFGIALQDADTSFSMHNDRQLFSVLAGAQLIFTIEQNQSERIADLSALCLVSGGAQSARSGVPVPDIPRAAARYLESRTGKRASLGNGTGLQDESPDVSELARELTIVSEETNMLWWLISECSRDLKKPWKKVGFPATAIVAGKELADLTRMIPGPVAATAFLDRVIRLSDPKKYSKLINIKGAIDAIPRQWREQLDCKSLARIQDLAPVSNAIRLSLTVDVGDDWLPVFVKGTGLEVDSTLMPNALAYQVFLECILGRLSAEVG